MRHKALGFALFLGVLLVAAAPARVIGDQYDQYDLEDDIGIFRLADDVEHHFYLAKVDLETKKYQESADEIRTGAFYLKLEANRAQGQQLEALVGAINELESIADKIQNGEPVSEKVLSQAFARAHYALAMNSWIKATEAWNQKNFKKASYALNSSQQHLAHAINWEKSTKKEEVKKKSGK